MFVGANIKKAAKDTFGARKFIACFAHTINLITNGSIDKCVGLNELVEKVRTIVKFIKNSVNVSDELRQYQKNEGLYLIRNYYSTFNKVLFLI